jgi:NAD(P)-dependent dehydrogenase (short-subunit alcohol dehydrogenase family)
MVFEGCTRIAAEYFAKAEFGGCIVNIASIYGMVAPRFHIYHGFEYPKEPLLQYCMVKAGIIQMNKWIAAKYGPRGVRCNSVSPGGIGDTKQPFKWQERYRKGVPLGEMIYPEDVAAAVAFLASDDANFISGQNLAIDGGLTAL